MTDVATVTIRVNGREYRMPRPANFVIEAAERAGTYVPRFCYHPRMEPVGICRMCLVEVDAPRGPTLQPACFMKVNDGMSVVTDSDKVKKAQDGVLEFLLANHPLDCPVCDKGGECPLQDQTLAHGSGETRFIEEKRHFVKPVEIGALVLLDRERCIQCARCTRFASDVAGDAEIAFAGRGDLIEVATSPTATFRLGLLRQHRADLSGGRADRQALSIQRSAVGPRTDREHVHDVRRGLPRRRPVLGQSPYARARRRQRARSITDGCATRADSRWTSIDGNEGSRSTH